MSGPNDSPRIARLLPLLLAAALLAEIAVGAAGHRTSDELAAAARSGDVRERAVALYRLAHRGDGSAATSELRQAAAAADPRLTVLVDGVLDDGPDARARRRALAANAATPELRRYFELMFERARTDAEYRELLAKR